MGRGSLSKVEGDVSLSSSHAKCRIPHKDAKEYSFASLCDVFFQLLCRCRSMNKRPGGHPPGESSEDPEILGFLVGSFSPY